MSKRINDVVHIKADVKHTREIDDNDKFYIVKGVVDNNSECWIGWIEKSFVEAEFMKKLPTLMNYSFKITDVIEFTDRREYEIYKLTH